MIGRAVIFSILIFLFVAGILFFVVSNVQVPQKQQGKPSQSLKDEGKVREIKISVIRENLSPPVEVKKVEPVMKIQSARKAQPVKKVEPVRKVQPAHNGAQASAEKRPPPEKLAGRPNTVKPSPEPVNSKVAEVLKSPDILPKAPLPDKKDAGQLPPQSLRVHSGMVDSGRQLLKGEKSVPVVHASYSPVGFHTYLRTIISLGGRMFIGDVKSQRILTEVIVKEKDGQYHFVKLDERVAGIEALALFRPREITGEALVQEALSKAGEIYNRPSDLTFVILLPLDREASLLGAIEEYLKSSGYQISLFDVIWGNYDISSGKLRLLISRGRMRKTEQIIQMNLSLAM